jgi:hypothetical protein
MNPYIISEMETNGNILSIKVEGPDGLCVWVHTGVKDVEAILSTIPRAAKEVEGCPGVVTR